MQRANQRRMAGDPTRVVHSNVLDEQIVLVILKIRKKILRVCQNNFGNKIPCQTNGKFPYEKSLQPHAYFYGDMIPA